MPNTRFSQRLKNRLNEEPKVQPNLRQTRAKQKPPTVVGHHQIQNKPNDSKQERKAPRKESKKERKTKTTLNRTVRPTTIQILQLQTRRRRKVKDGKPTPTEEKLLKKSYTDKGPALFGSVKSLKATTGIPRRKIKHFLHTEPAYTKYRSVRRKILRLKVIVYDINEIWSADLAYVDKLAKYNKDIKYLIVAVDCMSRYLRVQPLKSKYATATAEAFNQMIKTEEPTKVWVDKGTEFKGSFKTLCEKKGFKTYTTENEKKSAFAERNIRSLKSLIYKYLEDKWIYSYIDNLQDFVSTKKFEIKPRHQISPQ